MTADARRLLHIAVAFAIVLAILVLFHWLTGEPLFAIAGTWAVGGPIADWVAAGSGNGAAP